jgi:sulfite exporter TauE/SafE
MTEVILSALALGISTGVSCLVICTPFYLPYLIAEDRKLTVNFIEFSKFLLGRLAGYLLFGLIFSYLGEKLNFGTISFISMLSLALLSLLIILYSFNFFKTKFTSLACSYLKINAIKPPFLIGFLTGVNICPPFLLSLNYIFILGDIFKGLVYFFFFFIATSLYFIPLVFLGKLGCVREFQKLARLTMLIVGLIFLTYSIYNILTNQTFWNYAQLNY